MLKIGYLYPRAMFERKVDMGRVTHGWAVAKELGEGNFRVIGPGWEQWSEQRTVAENLDAMDFHPDCLWCFKAAAVAGVREWPGGLKAIAFNDAWNTRERLKEATDVGARLIVYHHANDCLRLLPLENDGCRLVHIPHVADRGFFCRAYAHPRPIDCLLVGVVNEKVYPLRAKWRQVADQKLAPVTVRRHPGYRLPNMDATEQQFVEYAAQLNQATVALTCSSVYKYALAKYAELMAAGCVVVSDMPDDRVFQATLGRWIVEVDPTWSLQQLARIVKDLLTDQDRIERLSSGGLREYMAGYTTEHYAAKFVAAVRDSLPQ